METKWKPLERTGGKAEMESDISAPEVAPLLSFLSPYTHHNVLEYVTRIEIE